MTSDFFLKLLSDLGYTKARIFRGDLTPDPKKFDIAIIKNGGALPQANIVTDHIFFIRVYNTKFTEGEVFGLELCKKLNNVINDTITLDKETVTVGNINVLETPQYVGMENNVHGWFFTINLTEVRFEA